MTNLLEKIMKQNISKLVVYLLSTAGILIVGIIDYITGVEIRIFPLYFIPVVIAAWFIGIGGVLSLSLIAAVVWMTSMYFGDVNYSHISIWVINFVTQGGAFVVVGLLVAKLNDAFKREHDLSRTDPLTGLCNTRCFYENASTVLSLCHRNMRAITLAYIDLDNFKHANDTHGHLHGDELLRSVAKIFNENLRASDVVARIGGDEFVILLPETGADDARSTLDKIRHCLAQMPQFQACSVTASIGAVSYSQAPADIGPLVQSADEIMYKVKNMNKNNVLIESI
jgi:diguanylate cyclase (GGDEF)-like protein